MKTENLSIKKNAETGHYDVLVNGKPTDLLIKKIEFAVEANKEATAILTVYLPDGVELDVDTDLLYRFSPKPKIEETSEEEEVEATEEEPEEEQEEG